jgi:hypothetical protein
MQYRSTSKCDCSSPIIPESGSIDPETVMCLAPVGYGLLPDQGGWRSCGAVVVVPD